MLTAAAFLCVVGAPPHAALGALGEIHGTVRLAPGAAVPEAMVVENTTDPAQCGETHTVQEVLVDPESRGLANAIVSLSGAPAPTGMTPETVVIDNTGCRFEPHVAVTTLGSTVEALNSDDVLHTVHLYGPIEANLGLPMKHMRRSQRIDQPGLLIVKCDVHGWMQAYVRVDPHPFHDVTDDQGAFHIGEIPPGEYTLEIWHEALGEMRQAITIERDETATVAIEYAGNAPRVD